MIMNLPKVEEEKLYSIVVNGENQYSIWPAERENPEGWKTIGLKGSKKQCLEFIQEVWTGMSPLAHRVEKELA